MFPEIASAAKLAIEHINNDISIGLELRLNISDTACDKATGMQAAKDLMQGGADVLLGAVCSSVCEYEATPLWHHEHDVSSM